MQPIVASPSDEQAIITRAMKGETEAFTALVSQYQNMAFSVAYRMLRDEDAAADVVQDSLIKAYRALHGFQGGNFRSWLMRIVAPITLSGKLFWQAHGPTPACNSSIVH